MGLTPLTLNGVSKYSSDLQSILNRAVQIAQIPVTALQNKDSDLLQKKSLLSGLESSVSSFAGSLNSLASIAGGQALTATSSNPAVVTVAATGATTPASYTIDSVTSPATAASERTLSSFADSASTPVSSTGTLDLVVGGNHNKFTLTKNSLVGLRDQINSLGAGVNASILTTSGGNFLSISSNTTGATTLQLNDDPDGANTNLLTHINQGTNAVFSLNGIPVTQAGNVVNSVVSGVTFTIQSATSVPVTLNLSSDRSQLSSALQSFVQSYNSLKQTVNAQVGQNAGLLSGDVAVTQLQSLLRQITSYTGTSGNGVAGSIQSLADLGIEFSTTGEASFNQNTFNQLSGSQISDGFRFLGSATSGFGAFGAQLDQFTDPVSGILKTEQDGVDRTDQSIQNQVSTLNDRITLLQTNLAAQLQKADAALAELQSQQNTVSASLQGLNLVLFGKSPNS
jgi:flagellar hook-associated protein 2